MAIDIVTIKNACQNMQTEAGRYDTVIAKLEDARETCKADTIEIDGATMGTKFDEIQSIMSQVKTYIIDAGNAVYHEAYKYYLQQKEQEEAEAAEKQQG